MMEGDLIEVALEETEHIWRLLQANDDSDDLLFEQQQQQQSFAPGRGFDSRYSAQQQAPTVYDLNDANIPVAVDTMFKVRFVLYCLLCFCLILSANICIIDRGYLVFG
jgi:hypothetical protein